MEDGISILPGHEPYTVVKGFTLLEVLIAFAIVALFAPVAFLSLSNMSNTVYSIKHREKNQALVEEINVVYTIYITGKATLIDNIRKDDKTCGFYKYENYYYTLCPEEGPVQRLYLGNGYNLLVSTP